MAKVLNIKSSLFQENGQSSQLTDNFIASWKANNPDDEIIHRDLVSEPVPHLSLEHFQAHNTPADSRSNKQSEIAELSDKLIEEISSADLLVLGIPMYNFNVPSNLHTYFDFIARAGVTFRYTENGPEGLLRNKKAVVLISRGGVYGDDHPQSNYLRQFLGFIGITDVEFVYAEGLAMGDEAKEKALATAKERIAELV
ncbi:FMN-dependent NADH-azoreductase [Microbulbifer sp. ZKSA004]|uniref:FMN-dependent NADH-azoreductase n=1 Tax=unclassified Microbulbifer TaxID=2619833 RepID=UPI0039B545A9